MIMGITEIVLLVLGIGVFVASFVIPEKKKKLREGERELGEAQIKELLEGQLEEVQEKVADAVEGAISYALEKAERSMERISNEKIMAINEYSDTVLESIHKNHEETVFLYDMLNDKYESLKSFASEVDKKAKEVKESARESVKVVEESARAVQASTKAVIQSELAEGDKKFQEVSDRVEDFPETKSFSLEEEEFSDGASADATVEEHVSVWPVEKSSSIKEEPEKKTERQEEKEEVKQQIVQYRKYAELIRTGDYYRLSDPFCDPYVSWLIISQDGRQALLSVVMLEIHGNMKVNYVKLKGLEREALYEEQNTGRSFYGSALMEAGLPMPVELGEYRAYQIELQMK